MDHRDYMDDQTRRLLEQTGKYITSGILPPIEMTTPAVDVAKINEPALGVMNQLRDQLTRQASDVIGTAIQGNTRLQDQIGLQTTKFADLGLKGYAAIGPSISEQIAASGTNVFDTYFGTGVGTIGQALESLKLVNQPPSISEALYGSKGLRSVYDTVGPSLSQMAAGLVDTEAWKGIGAAPAYNVSERWRKANVGALFGLSSTIASMRDSLELRGAAESSATARTLLGAAGALDSARVSALSRIELAPQYAGSVDEIISEDQAVAAVADAMERRLIDRFKISRNSAHNVVRVLIWFTTAAIMIGITQGIPVLGNLIGMINDSADLFSPKEFSKKAAKKLVPLPEDKEPKNKEE